MQDLFVASVPTTLSMKKKRRVQDSFKISPHFRSKKIASEDLLCVHSGLLHSHCEAALCRGFVERTLQGFDFMTEKKIFFFSWVFLRQENQNFGENGIFGRKKKGKLICKLQTIHFERDSSDTVIHPSSFST